MRAKVFLLLSFVAIVLCVGGCQTGMPAFSTEAMRPVFGMSAVPGQWEPEVDEFDEE